MNVPGSDDERPPVHIYVEHLQNIRTLSIQAFLATCSNKETKAYISANGDHLTLAHEGATASTRLPASLGVHNNITLTLPAAPTKDLTFRLNVESKPGMTDALGTGNGSSDNQNIIPWMAADLSPDTAICCAACQAELVSRGSVTQWKDLPSEGWAEMMDFWHCHKPDVPEDEHHHAVSNAGRGFAANSNLAAAPGVGLVGSAEFLFAPADCQDIELDPNANNVLTCARCSAHIGAIDVTAQGYKLHKSSLSISTNPTNNHQSYNTEKWLACTLLTATESQGVRRLAIYKSNTAGQVTHLQHIWLFAPDLTVASSAAPTPEPLWVAKIMYRDGEPAELEKLNGLSGVEGELELGKLEYDRLLMKLHESAKLLPQPARTFQAWKVGLLQRFTANDVKTGNNE